MNDVSPEILRTAGHALEKAETAQLAIMDLQREHRLMSEELDFLKSFNRRLLAVLRQHFELADAGLDELIQRVEVAQDKLTQKPGAVVAPLCPSCQRPLQQDSEACIYCGARSPH